MLTFKWYGQACFEIDDSTTIVTDPHDGDTIGLNSPPANVADLVTVSHGHHDHASGKDHVARESSVVVENSGSRSEEGINLKGVDSYHDRAEGAKRGENVILLLEVDGLVVCHLGDLGHRLGNDDIVELGSVDVLLVPVGGNYTIDGAEAADLTERMDPQVVVPMHYEVEGLTVDISGPGEFLEEIGRTYKIVERERLELDELPEEKLAVKLDCLAC